MHRTLRPGPTVLADAMRKQTCMLLVLVKLRQSFCKSIFLIIRYIEYLSVLQISTNPHHQTQCSLLYTTYDCCPRIMNVDRANCCPKAGTYIMLYNTVSPFKNQSYACILQNVIEYEFEDSFIIILPILLCSCLITASHWSIDQFLLTSAVRQSDEYHLLSTSGILLTVHSCIDIKMESFTCTMTITEQVK